MRAVNLWTGLTVLAIAFGACDDGGELRRTDAPVPVGVPPVIGNPLPDGPTPANWPSKPVSEWTMEDAWAARTGSAVVEEAGKAIGGAAFLVNPSFSTCCLTSGCAASGLVQFYQGTYFAELCVRSLGNARYNNLYTSAHTYLPGSPVLNDNISGMSGIVTQNYDNGRHRCLSMRVYQGPGPAPTPPFAVGSNNGTGLVIDRWGCSNYAGMGPSIFETNIKGQSGWGGWDGVTAISTDYWEI